MIIVVACISDRGVLEHVPVIGIELEESWSKKGEDYPILVKQENNAICS